MRITLLKTHASFVAWARRASIAPGVALWRHAPADESEACVEHIEVGEAISRLVVQVSAGGAYGAMCRRACELEDALLADLRVAHAGTRITIALGGVPIDATPVEIHGGSGLIECGVLVPGTAVEVVATAPSDTQRLRARVSDSLCCAMLAEKEHVQRSVIVNGHVLHAVADEDVLPGVIVVPRTVGALQNTWVDVGHFPSGLTCSQSHRLERVVHDPALITFLRACKVGLLFGADRCGKSTALRAIAADPLSPVSLVVFECEKKDVDAVKAGVQAAAECGPDVVLALDHVDSMFPLPGTVDAQPEDSVLALQTCMEGHRLARLAKYAAHWGVSVVLVASSPERLPPAIHDHIQSSHCMERLKEASASNIASAVPPWDGLRNMEVAKQQLAEALLWPTEHAAWFSANPALRPPRGVLLAGPSGSGKSLLARAFVAHRVPPSVHVVACAGPEVLRRYVGASEAALRALFADARRRAPSIIVIDEADAVVRRRGAGGEGVGDRLVNQMLTEVDASPPGVGVLLISSRPDLIDPAVLRPGRIDCHVFLPSAAGSVVAANDSADASIPGGAFPMPHAAHQASPLTPEAHAIGGLASASRPTAKQRTSYM